MAFIVIVSILRLHMLPELNFYILLSAKLLLLGPIIVVRANSMSRQKQFFGYPIVFSISSTLPNIKVNNTKCLYIRVVSTMMSYLYSLHDRISLIRFSLKTKPVKCLVMMSFVFFYFFSLKFFGNSLNFYNLNAKKAK